MTISSAGKGDVGIADVPRRVSGIESTQIQQHR